MLRERITKTNPCPVPGDLTRADFRSPFSFSATAVTIHGRGDCAQGNECTGNSCAFVVRRSNVSSVLHVNYLSRALSSFIFGLFFRVHVSDACAAKSNKYLTIIHVGSITTRPRFCTYCITRTYVYYPISKYTEYTVKVMRSRRRGLLTFAYNVTS